MLRLLEQGRGLVRDDGEEGGRQGPGAVCALILRAP